MRITTLRTIYSIVIPRNVRIQARLILVLSLLLFAHPLHAADTPDLEDQIRAISADLRCVVCQNLSIADSPSEMAKQMRAIVREQLQAGKSPQEIKDYFVSKYGEWVLLKPATRGISLLVWVVPFVALLIGLALGIFFIRRWTAKKRSAPLVTADPKLLARVREEFANAETEELDLEDPSPRAQLLQERSRLYTDLSELEFDYQAGRLSQADYAGLRRDIETTASTVLGNLDEVAASAAREKGAEKRRPAAAKQTEVAQPKPGLRGWQVAVGAAFLLVFGLTLGVVLTNSLRPRGGEGDSMTGDFLTGTPTANKSDVSNLMQEGRAAFNKQDLRTAIAVFKKVLTADPNQPEANSYMGIILMQAGHADGALIALDKALSQAPNFPMALWYKGMTLYQGKQDHAGAREVFEKLLPLLPAGEDRNTIIKVLGEIAAAGQKPQMTAKPAAAATPSSSSASAGQITGRITINPKLKPAIDPKAVLFIIARPAAGDGPPLAVKKIDRPTFPLSYSLGAENMMTQGMPFTGKLTITVRLDQDGNPGTRGAGDLNGDYKKNPVEVGSKNVDIVLDQVAK
ncbi:MAG: cytochrome c-type biogenesis protein CcmH [Deltaproteobacteria bacterium]|nr:cytochrome c-type biogenesis protein CcmH [Deltaproteobacteria bacterium]